MSIKRLRFSWSARYGNNIISLWNALNIHYKNKDSILEIPQRSNLINSQTIDLHSILKYKDKFESVISINQLSKKNTTNIFLKDIFWWLKHQQKYGVSCISFEERLGFYKTVCDILQLDDNINNGIDDGLVIHIRSTDIYQKFSKSCSYAQPPLAFYHKVISDGNFNQIYILSDDIKNLMSGELYNTYGSKLTIIDEPNVVKAFDILRKSTNVCSSTSSFFTTSVVLKPKYLNKKIYTYDYICKTLRPWSLYQLFDNNLNQPSYHFTVYDIEDYPYMVKRGNSYYANWTFDEQTIHTMLSYPIDKIKKIYGEN